MAASDQIRQMVNFILQEAHEKANEIRVKVCLFEEDFQLWKDPVMTTIRQSNNMRGVLK